MLASQQTSLAFTPHEQCMLVASPATCQVRTRVSRRQFIGSTTYNEIITYTSMPAGRESQSEVGLLMMYPFYSVFPVGIFCFFQSIFYQFVTNRSAKLDDDTFELESRKEDLTAAVQVTCIVGNSTRLQFLVDKSYLNGRRGVIMSTPDVSGKVAVLVDNRYEIKVEEFQLRLDVSDEELDQKRQFMMYKTGETRVHPYLITESEGHAL
jgi:hypothetical protein